MIIHYFGAEQVRAYLHDLLDRLGEDSLPKVVIALGHSGQEIADLLIGEIPEPKRDPIRIVRVEVNRDNHQVTILDTIDDVNLADDLVLIVDSALNSGRSMLYLSEHLARIGAKNFISYSLVIKRGSCFIPNFFGVIIEDTDRAFVGGDRLPNARLLDDDKQSFGYIRRLQAADVHLPTIDTGVSTVTCSFAELHYEATAKTANVYLYISGDQVCGYISFERTNNSVLVNVVAAAKNFRGRGVGTALMRWSETWARSCRCEYMQLWGISARVSFYEDMSYKVESSVPELVLTKDQTYRLMKKPILYHTAIP